MPGLIPRRPDRAADLPLTPEQQRLWLIDRLNPGWPAHNTTVFRLHGQLDAAALEGALTALGARHEVLRARFTEVDEEPRQRFGPPEPLPLRRVDLTGLAPAERDAELERRISAARLDPFDLVNGPMMRAELIRLAPVDGQGQHVLCLSLHHIVTDGTSWVTLLHDLHACYAALVDGRPLPEPAPGIDYGDYVAWLRQRPAGAEAAHVAYWADQLRGVTHLNLPRDVVAPAERDARSGSTVVRTLRGGLSRDVQGLARRLRCTPFMVFLAAWQAVLSRHSGRTDFCVGVPTAGRVVPDVEPVVGLFVNTLPLRTDLTGDPSIADLVRRVRRALVGGLTHQEVPLERIFDELDIPRGLGGGVLFETVANLHSEEQALAEFLPGITAEAVDDGDGPTWALDLSLDIWARPEQVDLMLRVDLQCFAPRTAELMLGHLENALRAAVVDPDLRVSQLPLDGAEAVAALERLGTGPAPADPPGDVVDLVAAQVRARPGATAVRCGGARLDYAGLDGAADALARRLRTAGAGHGSLVAVCLPRSPELVVALLAVLRAGAGYLPMDPADPPARRADVLAQARPAVLLASGALAAAPPAGPWTTLDTGSCSAGTDAGTDAVPPPERPLPGDLAYAIYTSGSTGTPKGVMISRAALASRVAAMRRIYRTGPADRVVQFATVAFDTHVEEIWPTLTAGAELVLLPPGEQLPDLFDGPDGAGLTVLDLPTPYWQELLAAGNVRWPRTLRLLVIGADQVEPWAVAAWRRQAPGCELVNSYGPTETTVIATVDRLDRLDEARRPAIGLPVDDTHVRVVDERLRPVAWGEIGELVIGGAGVALGYLGRPGATAERFVPDPFGLPGGRLYRTGDRVRWRHDGRLEFLGRADSQVKLRGYRVEPAEVRARLGALPGVLGAEVVVRGSGEDAALVGYAVLDRTAADGTAADGTAADGTARDPGLRLRRALAELLPAHLVPSAVVVLEAFPLGATGKVDLGALPAPASQSPADDGRPPESDAELLVAQVWQDVLGRGGLSATDSFFAVGGHSLTAVRVVSRLSRATGLEVPLRLAFENPTLDALATAVEELLLAELDAELDAELAGSAAGSAAGGDDRP